MSETLKNKNTPSRKTRKGRLGRGDRIFRRGGMKEEYVLRHNILTAGAEFGVKGEVR